MGSIDVKEHNRYVHMAEPEIVSEHGRHVSEQEYWEKYYEHPDFRYEWNNGILEELSVSDFKNNTMYYWFSRLFGCYFDIKKNGKVLLGDFGFRLDLPYTLSIRKPDLAIVLIDNATSLNDDDRSFKGIFDVCVELISDATKRDIKRDTVDKVIEYETAGVREYYILDASKKYMAFYRLNEEGIFVPIKRKDGDIVESEVLDGFRFRISDLSRQPPLEELAHDELYYDFVIPSLKMFKHRAEQEKQRADLLAAKLRALGISID